MPDLESYLRGLNVPQNVKADLWDAYDQSSDADDFANRIGAYSVPQNVKADLWDMKSGATPKNKPSASPVKALARMALGQTFSPPPMPKPPDPADARGQGDPKRGALAMPATPDPAGWRKVEETRQARTATPPMPKPPVPFGLRSRSPLEEAEFAGMGGFAPSEIEGARRMAESQAAGAKEAAAGARQMVGGGQPMEKRVFGASRAFRGSMQAAAPVLAPAMGAAAMAAPATTLWGMVAGTAAQEGVERAARAAGVPEGYARAAGDIAGLPGYAYGPFRALRPKIPAATSLADDAKPAVQLPDPLARIDAPNAPTQRIIPEPPRTTEVRPDPADVAPQPAAAAKPAKTAAVDPVATARELGGDTGMVPIRKLRDAGLTDQQITEKLGPDGLIPHESHLAVGHPDVAANPNDFLVSGNKVYAGVSAARRESQRGSFSRRPRTEGASAEEMRGTYEPAKQPQGPEDDFLNFNRINVTGDEEELLRKTIRGMIDRGEASKDVEPHALIIQEAKRLHPDFVREVSAEAAKDGLTTRAAVYSARERQNALEREILAHIKKRQDPTLDDAARADIDSKISAMERNVDEYLRITFGIRTNWGRNLASLKKTADNTLDFGTWMYKVAKAKGLPDPSMVKDKDRATLRDLISRAEDAMGRGDGKAAEDAKIGLAKFVRDQQQTGWLDTISALRKAGLLTGLRTHARNIGGNTAFAVLEEAQRIPSAFFDMVASAGTGRRTVAAPSVSGVKNAVMEAATRGVREAGEIIKRGATQEDLAKGDMPRELNFQKLREMAESRPDGLVKSALGRTNDMVNTYVNTTFRLLGAEDKIYRVYAMRRSIESQARVKAINEARAGAIPRGNIKSRAAELAKNPTDLMMSEAIAYSEFATFNSKNEVAQFVSRGRTALGPTGRFILDQIMPFVTTPTNVVARGTNYIPGTNFIPAVSEAVKGAGTLRTARRGMKYGTVSGEQYAQLKELVSANNQRAIVEAAGRGTIGTAVMLAGYLAAKDGRAIGLREERDPMRTVKQAAGQQDGSVLMNGKWRQISSFTPTATLFLLGASLYDQSTKKLANEAKRPWMMAGTYGKAIAETPMLQGMSMVSDAMKDPAQFGEQIISQQAGSFVPTFMSDAARAIDPNRKDYRPPEGGLISPALYGIQGRTPFWRSSQPDARDVFGRSLGGERTYPVDPFSSSKAKELDDPMLKMLLDAKVGVKPPDRFTGESAEHYRARKAIAGAAVERALRRINPNRLPSDPAKREKIIKKAIATGRKQARAMWNAPSFISEDENRRTEIMENMLKGLQK